MDSKQIADRAQFRRYAEAALSAMSNDADIDSIERAKLAFDRAIAMMIQESRCWEIYQLHALEAITADERNRNEQGS